MPEEKSDVFISYHTSSAGQTVQKVVSALENAGITCRRRAAEIYRKRSCPKKAEEVEKG